VSGPNGFPYNSTTLLVPGAMAAGLYYRLGSVGAWTLLGSGPTVISGSGELYLATNDIANSWSDNGGSFTVLLNPVPSSNTAPNVSVDGVTNAATYEIGAVPTPSCVVSDAEDGAAATATAVVDHAALVHGLGKESVSCAYQDAGGLADSDSVEYSIVDTGDPSISYVLAPSTGPNAAGWYNADVSVDWTCSDVGSGVQSCTDDVTLGEGSAQAPAGTTVDWAGNEAGTTVAPVVNIDKTAPSVALVNAPPGGSSVWSTAAAPTCVAADSLSGLSGSCSVTGWSTAAGTHTLSASATDRAGNTNSTSVSYTVQNMTSTGFYQPVDMGAVYNVVKGGSTVPLKFNVLIDGVQQTATSVVAHFSASPTSCSASAPVDDVEMVTTGATALRYDATGGQFVQNWKTPTGAGTCYRTTATLLDGRTITALFKLK
jgi:hypothetical protein